MRELSNIELAKVAPGEPITLTAVMAIMAAAVIAVVLFKLFMSKSGSTKVPGGWSFDWKS